MSVKYLLPCPCGGRVPVDAAQAGQRVRCACGSELEVPTLLGLRRLEQAAETPDKVRRKPTAWGPRQALVLSGSILVLFGIGLASWCLSTRPRFIPSALSPMNALTLWEYLKSGIDTRQARIEVWVAERRASANLWAGVGGALAAIGALMFVGALALARPSRKSPGPPAS